MVAFDELQKMTAKELNEEFGKAKLNILKLRLGLASRQEKETDKLKRLRKYIARIRTLQHMLPQDQIPENPMRAHGAGA